MNTLLLPCEVGKVSDGYHTFDELYEHRCLLFCLLLKFLDRYHHSTNPWKALLHSDGTSFEGWFIAGFTFDNRQITYHLPIKLFNHLNIETISKAPEFDGHTSQDVLERLLEMLKG